MMEVFINDVGVNSLMKILGVSKEVALNMVDNRRAGLYINRSNLKSRYGVRLREDQLKHIDFTYPVQENIYNDVLDTDSLQPSVKKEEVSEMVDTSFRCSTSLNQSKNVGHINGPPKHIKFDGKSNFKTFVNQFKRWAQVRGLDEDQYLVSIFTSCFEGQPLDFVSQKLDNPPEITFEELTQFLFKFYDEEDFPSSARRAFELLEQKMDESIREWAMRVLTVAQKAFGEYGPKLVNSEAVNRFCIGALDKETSAHILMKAPETVEEAKYLMSMEIQTKNNVGMNSKTCTSILSSKGVSFGQEHKCEPLVSSNGNNEVLIAITKLTEAVNKLMPRSSSPYPRREGNFRTRDNSGSRQGSRSNSQERGEIRGRSYQYRSSSRNQASGNTRGRFPNIQCHHCKEMGHYRNECPQRLGNGRGSDGGAA